MTPQRHDIYVAMLNGGTPTPVGILSFAEGMDSNGKKITGGCRFSYFTGYNGPPLDPVHLDYAKDGQRVFALPPELKSSGVFRVFSDSLPGSWGRRLLAKDEPVVDEMNDLQLLAYLSKSGRTTGALFMYSKSPKDECPLKKLAEVDAVRVKSLLELGNMAVVMTEQELNASIIHGGARPKAAFHDVKGEVGRPNSHYIVKFNHKHDAYNCAIMEQSTLEMAIQAGIKAVRSLVVAVRSPDGKVIDHMFLTERYDRFTADDGKEYRCHKVSLLALTDPQKVPSQDRGDYRDAINAVKAVSTSPKEDSEMLFRRMLFNIGVNNTDDHLKNHEMLVTQDSAGNRVCRLAPAYDLLPISAPCAHTTKIAGNENGVLSREFVAKVAVDLGIDPVAAEKMRTEVVAALANWQKTLERNHCSGRDMDYMRSALAASGVRALKSPFALPGQVNPLTAIARLETPTAPPTAMLKGGGLLGVGSGVTAGSRTEDRSTPLSVTITRAPTEKASAAAPLTPARKGPS